ncbi:succinylglutamate desuccinylase/aspartoacylase family protein [Natronococcus wangiae]|uniref:succinylglutamate desuccinylase/aspartoacylase family protein n=1 Tax=Natronococcus wangiae TaxID=3068275 RepID=UPI00273F0C97|nr:succinylglutamate desuccinylase/aspartoacylase family protein [Natronococcus sp. AD5]
MAKTSANEFRYGGSIVQPGERIHFRHTIGETYLGDPIRVPVTIVNGAEPGLALVLVAALHGDELNGVETVRHIADEWNHARLRGTLVCLHVVNVPWFNAQERYLPLDDSDLNRSFPGSNDGTAAQRIAYSIYETFVRHCDLGIDILTSTRGRTNLVHVRGDLRDDRVDRLARAFDPAVILSGTGPDGSLRKCATERGVPTITVEMGEAERFQRHLIDEALRGIRSVFGEFDLYPDEAVRWGNRRGIVSEVSNATWLRADEGGIVEMHVDSGEFVDEQESICTITNPFSKDLVTVDAPFDGVVLGLLETPVVWPGNPLCHLVPATGVA